MTITRRTAVERLDRAGVLGLQAEWDDLWERSGGVNPFLTWAWISAWLETVGADADLEFHVVRDAASGRLVAAAPFYVAHVRRAGTRLLELRMVGSGTAAPDHLDLLVAGDEGDTAGAEVWAAVTVHRRWDVVHLDGLDANGRLAGIAATAPNSTPTPCPFLPLDGGWEAVELGFGSQLRKNLTRYGRKLERDAEVNVRLAADHDALDVAFDTLMRLHQSIRTAKGDPGVFARSDMRAFLRLATHRMLDAGHARLWSLEADGETIAAILCFLTGDVMSFYTTGYDEAWAKYGPGRRIMAEAVKGAIDEGASTFDFLRGDEAYKREWGTHDRFDTVVYQPVSWKGRASTMARHLVRTTRNALRSQP